jgi:hypothetical protein
MVATVLNFKMLFERCANECLVRNRFETEFFFYSEEKTFKCLSGNSMHAGYVTSIESLQIYGFANIPFYIGR